MTQFSVWYNSEEDINTQKIREVYSLTGVNETRNCRHLEFDSLKSMAQKIVELKLTEEAGDYTSIRIANAFVKHYIAGVPLEDRHSGVDFFELRERRGEHYQICEGRKLNGIEMTELKKEIISRLEDIEEE